MRACPQAKEAKLEMGRLAAEYEALQACTFTPQISAPPPQATGPVVVRGLGRYLELRDMARKQEDERR